MHLLKKDNVFYVALTESGAADTIESIEVVETGGNRSVITLGEKI